MFVPIGMLVILGLLLAFAGFWCVLSLYGWTPLPFFNPGPRLFSTSSTEAKRAIVDLLSRHGLKERCQFDGDEIQRSIMLDGTIIVVVPEHVIEKLDGATSCIGLVTQKPVSAAREAADLLRASGFSAKVVFDVEPNDPMTFVVTNALRGSALQFGMRDRQMRPVGQINRPKSYSANEIET